jgi:hypothetical protein
MINKSFLFNLTPLSIANGIMLSGTVPDEQNYSNYTGEYIPDYSVTPVLLLPWVNIRDKDNRLVSGGANSKLTNIKWVEIVGDTETVITTGTDYEVVTSGANAGLLRVKKNITPDTTVTLKFSATYVDDMMKQTFYIQDSYLLSCYSASKSVPSLSLGIADSSVYNPLSDADTVAIAATLYVGNDGEVPTKNREFVWDVSRDGTTFHDIGSTNLDYYISLNSEKTVCTLDRSLMGNKVFIRCRAKYDEGGDPSSVTLSSDAPSKTVTVTRQIPAFSGEIFNVPTEIPYGTLSIAPEAKVFLNGVGEISNWENVIFPIWYIATNVSSGNPTSKTQVAEGVTPKIPTTKFSETYGAILSLDLTDRGPLCAAVDSDGNVFTDSDGKIFVFN